MLGALFTYMLFCGDDRKPVYNSGKSSYEELLDIHPYAGKNVIYRGRDYTLPVDNFILARNILLDKNCFSEDAYLLINSMLYVAFENRVDTDYIKFISDNNQDDYKKIFDSLVILGILSSSTNKGVNDE